MTNRVKFNPNTAMRLSAEDLKAHKDALADLARGNELQAQAAALQQEASDNFGSFRTHARKLHEKYGLRPIGEGEGIAEDGTITRGGGKEGCDAAT